MKLKRSQNASRNIFYGILFRLVATFCPFVMRTVLLYTLGVQYLGLNSLFTSLLSFLSLTELGIGNAMVFAMYKPIAQDDDETICALLKLYKQLYLIIGSIILAIGLCLFPFIDHFVNSGVPDGISLRLLYLIYLANTVLSYFLFGYKQSILMAFQRNDIISKRALVLRIAMYALQAFILLVVKNYYLYIIVLVCYTLSTNIANSIIVDRMYPQYVCKGEVSKETKDSIRKNVLALMGSKMSDIVLNSLDNVVLSAFIGLSMVAMFDNYYYVFNAVVGLLMVVYQSLTAGLGNSLETEELKKNYNDFNLLTFINSWLVTWCATCILCLMQPFIEIWVGRELMFPAGVVVLFVIYFYLIETEKIVLTYKDAAGLWWPDRLRPYIVMGTNLVLNILSVRYWGVYGILGATIVSLLISIPWSSRVVVRGYFHEKHSTFAAKMLHYMCNAVIACGVTYVACSRITLNGVMGLILRFLICCCIPNMVLLLLNLKNKERKLAQSRILKMVKKRC